MSVPSQAVKKISAAQGRQNHMRVVVEEVGAAMHLDVKLHSVSGRRDGRTLHYPPELIRVVKSMNAAPKISPHY